MITVAKQNRVNAYSIRNEARGFRSDSNMTTDSSGTGLWLRSPGDYLINAALVGTDGSLYSIGVESVDGVVRPALWLDLESDIF